MNKRLIFIFFTFILLMLLVGISFVFFETKRIEQEQFHNLESIVKLKAAQIENWLAERQGDCLNLSTSVNVASHIHRLHKNPDDLKSRDELLARIKTLQSAYRYSNVLVTTGSGQVLLAATEDYTLSEPAKHLLQQAINQQQVLNTDLYVDELNQIRMDWAVPLTFVDDQHNSSQFAVILRVNPHQFLFPMIETWPTPSETAETILVRQEGEAVLFLNELRHRQGSGMSLTQALSPSLPAAMSLLQQQPGIMQGEDYRQVSVYSAFRPIQGTNWHIVAKIDRTEVLAPLWQMSKWFLFITIPSVVLLFMVQWRLMQNEQQLQALLIQAEKSKADGLQTLFFALPFIGMAIISVKTKRWLQVNDRFCEMLGYSRDELNQLSWSEITASEDLIPERNFFVQMCSGEIENYHIEKRFTCKNGSSIDTQVDVRGHRSQDGNIEYLIATIEDITERKRHEQALQESESRFRSLFANTPIAYQSLDINGCFLEVNQQFCEMLGYEKAEIIGREFDDFWLDEYKPLFVNKFTTFKQQGHVDSELVLTKKDGSPLIVLIVGQIQRDQAGKFVRTHCVITDITERKIAEQQLAFQRNLYETLAKINEIIIHAQDRQQLFVDICRIITTDSGLMKLAWVGVEDPEQQKIIPVACAGHGVKYLDDIFISTNPALPESQGPTGSAWRTQKPVVSQENCNNQALLPWANRVQVFGWRSSASFPVLHDEKCDVILTLYHTEPNIFTDEIVGLLNAMVMDVGFALAGFETKHALIESENRFRKLFADSYQPLLLMEHEKFIDANHAALQQLGLDSLAAFVGKSVTDISPELQPDGQSSAVLAKQMITEAFASGFHRFEWVCNTITGEPFVVDVMLNPIVFGDRQVLHIAWHDITDQKQTAAELEAYRLNLEKLVDERTQKLLVANLAITASEERFRNLFESTRDAVIILSVAGLPIDANPAAINMFGCQTLAELLTLTTADVSPEYQPDGCRSADKSAEMIQLALQNGSHFFEWRHRRQDDSEFLVEVNLTVITLDGEKVLVSNARDISERKKNQQALEDAKLKAEESARAKSEFLANMSHEIRTPMNGVIGMLDVLMQTPLSDEQQKMATVIRESAHAQLAVINDILDFSKIEAGKMELSLEPFSLEILVESVGLMLDQLAQEKQVGLRLFVDPCIPKLLNGDVHRFRQILANLINNAIKFSSQLGRDAKVYIRVELLRQVEQFAWVKLIVSDNGIGISPAAQAKLFQQFVQADASTTRTYGGTGLGLAICKRLVELMGGEIRVQSQEGQGSEFSVELPFEILSQPADPEPAILTNLPCLIIGPDNELMTDLAVYLKYAGVVISKVADVNAVKLVEIPDKPLWIWIYETGSNPAFDQLLNAATALQQASKHLLDIRYLTIASGRRQNPRWLTNNVMQVDTNLLLRQNILHTLAMLTGNESYPLHAVVKKRVQNQVIDLSREQAIQQGKLILVVEDNQINQEVIFQQLKLLGYVADITNDGQQGFAEWQQQQYALVLTDIHMPYMDGYQLTHAIRTHEAKIGATRTPIVALTALAMQGEAENCIALGMDDYLSKPMPLELLKFTLEKWLQANNHASEPKQESVLIPANLAALHDYADFPDWDAAVLSALVGNDPVVLLRFLDMFVNQMQQQKVVLENAEKTADVQTIASTAHLLKSGARSVGAMKMGEICQALEIAGKAQELENCIMLKDKLYAAFERVVQQINA